CCACSSVVSCVEIVWCIFFFVFFFSSRRRHTRWPRDWSSDVCFPILMNRTNWTDLLYTDAPAWSILVRLLVGLVVFLPEGIQKRSEERRVGKECRYRWSEYQ